MRGMRRSFCNSFTSRQIVSPATNLLQRGKECAAGLSQGEKAKLILKGEKAELILKGENTELIPKAEKVGDGFGHLA